MVSHLSRTRVLRTHKIPAELRQCAQWVLWRFIIRDDQSTKVPFQPNGKKAKCTDPDTWSTFESVMACVDEFDGIGFVFSADDEFVGVDLDDVVVNGKLQRWNNEQQPRLGGDFPQPREILNMLGSYAEISPSGNGIKTIARSDSALPGNGRKRSGFEIYDRDRFFTITGRRLKWAPPKVEDGTATLHRLYEMLPGSVATTETALDWSISKHPAGVSDEQIIRRMLIDSQYGNQEAYRLWKGNTDLHGDDHSSCDIALVNYLAFYAGPYPTLIDRLFRQSNLMRKKWERQDYREMTIGKVLASKEEFCSWNSRIKVDADDEAEPASDGFPSELLVVPGFVEEVRQYTLASAFKQQPVLSLAGALALLATLLGNRVSCQQGCFTNLMFVMVGATGCGKDRPRRTNNEILAAVEASHMLACENPASGPAILRAMECDPVQLAQIDELGRFLSSARDSSSNAHSVISELMKLFTSYGQAIRKPYADTKRTFQVNSPLLVLLGATTPDALFEAVSESNLQDGLIPRLDLWVGEDFPEPAGFNPSRPLPGSVLDFAGRYLDIGPDQLSPAERPPRRLKYSNRAANLFAEYQRCCMQMQQAALAGGDVWTRSARKAATFAILHAMSRNPDCTMIDDDAMHWGIEIQRHLTQNLAQYLGKWCASTSFDRRQKQLLRKVGKNGGWMSASQLTRSSQHMRPRERDELIENLLDTGQLKELEIRTKGRPRRYFYDPSVIREDDVESTIASRTNQRRR